MKQIIHQDEAKNLKTELKKDWLFRILAITTNNYLRWRSLFLGPITNSTTESPTVGCWRDMHALWVNPGENLALRNSIFRISNFVSSNASHTASMCKLHIKLINILISYYDVVWLSCWVMSVVASERTHIIMTMIIMQGTHTVILGSGQLDKYTQGRTGIIIMC